MEPIRKAVDSYTNDLDALRGMLDPVMIVAEELGKRFDEEHLKSLVEFGTELEPDGETRNFHIPPEHLRKIKRISSRNEQFVTARTLLPRTFLVSFVSAFDAYLGTLVQALFSIKPEVLNSSNKQLTFKDLVEFESVDSAREFVIESEIDSLLRKSHAEQFEWLEKTFEVKLTKGLKSWQDFIELTERRNLFVHNHGRISSQYLKVCKNHGVPTDDLKVGQTLDAKRDYLINAYKVLYEIGVKLSQVLWRKLREDDLEKADLAIINVTFDLLINEKYDISRRILEFIVSLPKQGSDANRRICIVNLAQCYKHTGDSQGCLDVLNKVDWSACSDDFAVCVAALRDDFPAAAEAMHKIGANGKVKRHDYLDWPVFKHFRESDEFSTAFSEIFGAAPVELQTHKPLLADGNQTAQPE